MKSLLIPIHNEAQHLPYVLQPLKQCNVDEIVFLMDRCTDASEAIIRKHFFTDRDFDFNVIMIIQDWPPSDEGWLHPTAYVAETLQEFCRNDLRYLSAGDIIIDPEIFNLPHTTDLQSYRYNDGYDTLKNAWISNLRKLPFIHRCSFGQWSGIFSMKREVWQALHYRDVLSNDLDFFERAFKAGFTHNHVSNCSITHLRPGTQAEKQLQQVNWRLNQGSTVKTLLHAALTFKLPFLREYTRQKIKMLK